MAQTQHATDKEIEPPRRLRIERKDLEIVGYTPGCPGCYAARHRRPHKTHTEHRRRDVVQRLLKVPELAHKVQAAEDRERAWLDKEFGDELQRAADDIDNEHKHADPQFVPPPTSRDREFAREEPPPVFTAPPPAPAPEQHTNITDDMDEHMDINAHIYEKLNDHMMHEINSIDDNDNDLSTKLTDIIDRYSMYVYQMLPP